MYSETAGLKPPQLWHHASILLLPGPRCDPTHLERVLRLRCAYRVLRLQSFQS